MPAIIDLHAHSTRSDGVLAPAQLVSRAVGNGVSLLALTDHDTMDGLAEARNAAMHTGLKLINGVEISTTWNGRTFHILGLDINPLEPTLADGLARLRAFRVWRAEEIARRLARAGIPEPLNGARSFVKGAIVSRSHFARYLVSIGKAKDFRRAIKRWLVKGGPGHVPGDWAELNEVVGWIRRAGGLPVIAHPARYRLTRTKLKYLIDAFVGSGGLGIEVLSGSHSLKEAQGFSGMAQRYGLLASVGSDFHSPDECWMDLGGLPELPKGCQPVWERFAA